MKRSDCLALLVSLLLFTACGGDAAESESMVIEDVWGRPLPSMAENGAFYMTIINNTDQDDVLRSVRTEACGAVELHRTSVDDQGVMQMRPVEGQTMPVRRGQTIALVPVGLHVMCLDVARPFEPGQVIPLTLVFDEAGEIVVVADIREEAP